MAATVDEQVSGSFTEIFARGESSVGSSVLTGSLAGTGLVRFFSREVIDPQTVINIVSKRTVFTSRGNLFLLEVGQRHGKDLYVESTVTGGTESFKGATGYLILMGHIDPGVVSFEYTGTLTFKE